MSTTQLKLVNNQVGQDKNILNNCNYAETMIEKYDTQVINIISQLSMVSDVNLSQITTLSQSEIISHITKMCSYMFTTLVNVAILQIKHTIHNVMGQNVCQHLNVLIATIQILKQCGVAIDVQAMVEKLAAFLIKKIQKYSTNEGTENLYQFYSMLLALGVFKEVRSVIGRNVSQLLNCFASFMQDHQHALKPEHNDILMTFLLVIDQVFQRLNGEHVDEDYENLVSVLQLVKKFVRNEFIITATNSCLFLVPF